MRSNGSGSLSSFVRDDQAQNHVGRRDAAELHEERPGRARAAPAPGDFEHVLVHTGQHYDDEMSQVFIDELGDRRAGPLPRRRLGLARAADRARDRPPRAACSRRPSPIWCSCPGDVNSTLAARPSRRSCRHPRRPHRGRPAQLRPQHARGDQPDHRRRDLASSSSSTRPRRATNLLHEGAAESAIHYVGNTMIDTLTRCASESRRSTPPAATGSSAGRISWSPSTGTGSSRTRSC